MTIQPFKPISMKKLLLLVTITFVAAHVFAGEENEIKAIVNKWNELHNTRNTIEFKQLYAPNVLYYGKFNSGKQCYQKKKAFLSPDFYQEIITPVTLTYYSSGTIKCSFTKRVIFKGKSQEHICYLLVEKRNNGFLITGESEVMIDQKLGVKLNLGAQIQPK